MSITRRSLLGAILGAAAAPAIVRVESLMKLPSMPMLWADGLRDDAAAMQWRIDRGLLVPAGTYFIGKPVHLREHTCLRDLVLRFGGAPQDAAIIGTAATFRLEGIHLSA